MLRRKKKKKVLVACVENISYYNMWAFVIIVIKKKVWIDCFYPGHVQYMIKKTQMTVEAKIT